MRRGETRAILLPAFRHDLGNRRHCPIRFCSSCACAVRRKGAALVWTKSVRLRLSLHGRLGGLGVRPDLCAWSKTIAKDSMGPSRATKFRAQFSESISRDLLYGGCLLQWRPRWRRGCIEQNQAVGT